MELVYAPYSGWHTNNSGTFLQKSHSWPATCERQPPRPWACPIYRPGSRAKKPSSLAVQTGSPAFIPGGNDLTPSLYCRRLGSEAPGASTIVSLRPVDIFMTVLRHSASLGTIHRQSGHRPSGQRPSGHRPSGLAMSEAPLTAAALCSSPVAVR
eukprot:366370-Chlamydomonas_euryale.AAC.3